MSRFRCARRRRGSTAGASSPAWVILAILVVAWGLATGSPRMRSSAQPAAAEAAERSRHSAPKARATDSPAQAPEGATPAPSLM